MTRVPVLCRFCGAKSSAVLRRNISANGLSVYFFMCKVCGENITADHEWVSGSVAEKWQNSGKIDSLDDIPVINDYRGDLCQVETCTSVATECLHVMPAHFGTERGISPREWPTFLLCHKHFLLWSKTVVWYEPNHCTDDEKRDNIKTYNLDELIEQGV